MTDLEKQHAMNEALEHQRFGRLDDAEDVYRRIISADPNQAGVLNNLANILKDTGRIEEAVEVCRARWRWSRGTRRFIAAFVTSCSFIRSMIARGFSGNSASGTGGMADVRRREAIVLPIRMIGCALGMFRRTFTGTRNASSSYRC